MAIVTETWLTSHKSTITAELKSVGYDIKHSFRDDKRGGGVGIIHKANINFSPAKPHNFISFECVSSTMPRKYLGGLNVIAIYRHGAISNAQFLTEFYNFVESTQQSFNNFIVCGDFNLHFNDFLNSDIIEFNKILSSFSLTQHIKGPTHKLGNTLDFVISNPDVKVSNVNIDLQTLSDHALISFKVHTEAAITKTKLIQVRKCDNVDTFTDDLSNKVNELISIAPSHNFHEAITIYRDMCANLVDHHAPVREISIAINSQPKWMDSEFKDARRKRRSLYKKQAKSQKPQDKLDYQNCKKLVHELSVSKRKLYYSKSIADCGNSQKELSNVCNSLLDREKSSTLPQLANISPKELANRFNTFFIGKITKIRSSFNNDPFTRDADTEYHGPKLCEFQPTTDEELKKVITSKPIKASKNDHIPRFLLIPCLDVVTPLFTHLINLSLSTGCIEGLKDSIVTPLLKKQGLDSEDLSNYRPVCDIKFLHKLIEKTVLPQLNNHMTDNNLHTHCQSGYKRYHSCETLLLRVINDVLVSMDNGRCTVLLLLDLSAAFDTVDHVVLLNILYHEIGIRGIVMEWFQSYLLGRRQCTIVNGNMSDFAETCHGVPQGSVLGPVLFNIYVRSFIKAIQQAGFSIQGYADDHQIAESFRIEFQFNSLRCSIPNCLQLVSFWMSKYFLKLNATKSQVIVFHPQNQSVVIDHVIMNDNSFIKLSDVVNNLGCKMDSYLTFSHQISSTVSQGYQTIRDIGKIKKYLSKNDVQTLITQLVISRIDLYNSLLFGISSQELYRLQKLQNACTRLIYGLCKSAHVSDLFQELHWLPVRSRIIFKIVCFVYKCLHNIAPSYLSSLLEIDRNTDCTLIVPRRFHKCGDRAFSSCGPALWNACPLEVRQCTTFDNFKRQLKHHLFSNFNNYIQALHRYRC